MIFSENLSVANLSIILFSLGFFGNIAFAFVKEIPLQGMAFIKILLIIVSMVIPLIMGSAIFIFLPAILKFLKVFNARTFFVVSLVMGVLTAWLIKMIYKINAK